MGTGGTPREAQVGAQLLVSRRPVARWLAFAAWLCLLCALGGAHVSEVLKGPHVLTLAFSLALAGTVSLGAQAGYLRDWRLVPTASVTGAAIPTAGINQRADRCQPRVMPETAMA
jgi:hypothetical protein